MDELIAYRSMRNAWQRVWVAGSAAIVACACSLGALAQGCPASDPDQNYNCPIGPVYALPDWGNVPWSLPEYSQTLVAGDLDGDGRDELVGRDARGIHVWSFDTARGVWRPWLATDGSGLLVLPLSDAAQWNLPQYYSVIRLISVAGEAGKVLVGRGSAGVLLYKLTHGSVPGVDLPAGKWTQLTTGGPFADADCFSNQKCWNAAPYYQTIRFGDIDGAPGDEVIGWGGDGIVAFKWNGSSWAGITGLPAAGDAGGTGRSDYLSLRFGDIDGEPGQELLQWTSGGVTALKYVPGQAGGTWAELQALPAFGSLGPPCTENNTSGNPSCWSTLQTASLGSGGDVVVLRLLGCSANGGGMAGARYNHATQIWQTLFVGGPFDDCAGFTQPQYYETIQFARITGSTLPELIGRGPGGVLVYQWNGANWTPLSTNVPALADPTWASDPSYWQSIRTANVDGSGRAALVARGQTGVRTWLWQNGALARPLPYGGFPPFTGAEGTAYNLLNQFLALGQGTIRDTYTNPAVDNTSSALRGYVSQIVNARGACKNEMSANPPQYQTCDPLVGATNPAYTTMVNQVIKELWWAASVVDHFTTIQTMQNALFSAQGNEFPSIAENLQLAQAQNLKGTADYLSLFSSISSLAGNVVGIGVPALGNAIQVAAHAVNVEVSALAFFSEPPNTVFQHTYAEIQGQIASLQQSGQTNNLAQKHYVLSDYALLSSIGQLTASQVWTVDEAGYLSANRLAFTTWVYQVFLPLLWARYEVTGCGQNNDNTLACYPPPDGANMAYYQTITGPSNNYVDFTGLLPIAVPICVESCNSYNPPQCTNTCNFPAASATTVNVLFTPVSQQCTYNPQAGTAWVYANPNANPPVAGCTVGAAPAIFGNQSGWSLPVVPINLQDDTLAFAIDKSSRATDIGGAARLRISGLTRRIDPRINLRTTTLTLRRLLSEPYFGGELVDDLAGTDFAPLPLLPTFKSRASKATFETPADVSPRVTVDLHFRPNQSELRFDIDVDSALIGEPLLCLGTPATTKLELGFQIAGGGLGAPQVLSQVQDWECVFDHAGRVTELRATGNGVRGFTPN
jgi:hypothetical protein